MNHTGTRYITKQEDYKKFDADLAANFSSTFNCTNTTDANTLDEELQGKADQYNTEDLIHDCSSCVTKACNAAFRRSKGRKLNPGRTVPWWNTEVNILWKKVKALRRRFQRTLNNEDLRRERKGQYEGKRQYLSKLQEEKFVMAKILLVYCRFQTLERSLQNCVWEIKKLNLPHNSPAVGRDLYPGGGKHDKAYAGLFCSRR
jgi:hypothetical protein